jgi:hypothetical protein
MQRLWRWFRGLFLSDYDWKKENCAQLYNWLFEMSPEERTAAWEAYCDGNCDVGVKRNTGLKVSSDTVFGICWCTVMIIIIVPLIGLFVRFMYVPLWRLLFSGTLTFD